MSHAVPILASGLALLVAAAAQQAPAAQPYFDPVLSGVLCTPGADQRRRLLGYYRKVAAATETRPFPPAASSGDPPANPAMRRSTTISAR